jgi:hypothetical protein
MIRVASVALAIVLSGCATSLGTVGVVVPDGDAVGVKLLQPGVTGSSCRRAILGVRLDDGEPSLDEALRRILAVDTEGNVVVNAEVRWRRFVTGLYDRRCVEVRGDLARTASTITLPTPPGHHHGHP